MSKYKDLEPSPYSVVTAWGLDFCFGNVVKYVARYQNTKDISDLKKAKQYLEYRIYELENNAN